MVSNHISSISKEMSSPNPKHVNICIKLNIHIKATYISVPTQRKAYFTTYTYYHIRLTNLGSQVKEREVVLERFNVIHSKSHICLSFSQFRCREACTEVSSAIRCIGDEKRLIQYSTINSITLLHPTSHFLHPTSHFLLVTDTRLNTLPCQSVGPLVHPKHF